MIMSRTGCCHPCCLAHAPPNKLHRLRVAATGAQGSSADSKAAAAKQAVRRAPVRKGTAAGKLHQPPQPELQPVQPRGEVLHDEACLQAGETVTGRVQQLSAAGARVEIEGHDDLQGWVPLRECSLASLESPLEALRTGMWREFEVKEVQQQAVVLSRAAVEARLLQRRAQLLYNEGAVVAVTMIEPVYGGSREGVACVWSGGRAVSRVCPASSVCGSWCCRLVACVTHRPWWARSCQRSCLKTRQRVLA